MLIDSEHVSPTSGYGTLTDVDMMTLVIDAGKSLKPALAKPAEKMNCTVAGLLH